MNKRYVKAVMAILVVFAIGLVGYYTFSAAYGDGLEKTMEDNGVSEGEPVWQAPLDYGEDYVASLLMGILGFVIVLAVVLAYLMLVKARKRRTD
ncbi:MAG: cobalt transporter [Methanomassiliicoccales archaeon]|nr:MAG: cobalt transporter [Methanomassiliicoccales archaeon]